MMIYKILQELYYRVSLSFRSKNYINYPTIFLSLYSILFKIIIILFNFNYNTQKNETVKKSVRHYYRMLSLLYNSIVFSNIVNNGVAGADITHFSTTLVETVKIPRVKIPFILIADTPEGIETVPNFVDTVWTRKDGIITVLQNSPIRFFSAGGR
jgi:hypothetical protein